MDTLHSPESPLLDHCPATLPRAAYVDPDWFAREERAIRAREWVHVGRRDAFAPGHAHRREIAGHPILIVRQGDHVRAYHNLCRHRGAELCADDDTRIGARLTCPYHAWTYAADDGRLLSTAHATPTADFDRAAHALLPVHTHVWNGFVFVCLAGDPPAFAPDLGTDALDHWPMEGLMVGHRTETRVACNWKVFWENYNECLHCPGIHPELSALVPVYARGVMTPAETAQPPEGPTLRAGAQSWTISGAPCGPTFPGLTPQERAEGHRFVTLYPTMFIVAHVDHVRAVTVTPLDATTTHLTAEWLFAPATLSTPGFRLTDVTDFATMVMAQDAAACEMNQRGLASPAFTRGTLMPQEFDVRNFHRWVTERLDSMEDTP